MIEIHEDSHTDHLPAEVIDYIRQNGVYAPGEGQGVYVGSLLLPPEIEMMPCILHGPAMGEQSVGEDEVYYAYRIPRAYASRICRRPATLTNLITYIVGPHAGKPNVLYSAFAGPRSPKEPNDISLREDEVEESKAFWSQHALS